jgi:hypothetical protein
MQNVFRVTANGIVNKAGDLLQAKDRFRNLRKPAERTNGLKDQ